MTIRSLIPDRSPEDIAFGRARVVLGGQVYSLPALPWAASDEWLLSIDGRMAALVSALEDAGNDTGAITNALMAEPEHLFDALIAYDTTGVLPPAAQLKATATKNEVLIALLGVWRAANPLVDVALSGMTDLLTSGLSSVLSSSPPEPTDGPPTTPTDTRPRNGSSRTSTSRRTGTSKSSSKRSTPPDSAASSRPTPRRTNGGAASPTPSPRALAPSVAKHSRLPS